MAESINVCWLRRDLRIDDNPALYHALKVGQPVLVLFIFDTVILDQLDEADPRVTFIYDALKELESDLATYHSAILVKYGKPQDVWPDILKEFDVKGVYANADYEPYARERDDNLFEFLSSEGIPFKRYKDHVIFEKDEIVKPDGKPYTVYSPYAKQWQRKLNAFYYKPYPTRQYTQNLCQKQKSSFPKLGDIGFIKSGISIPGKHFEQSLQDYETKRDFPAADATSRIGIHLRFGTVSIRYAVKEAIEQKAHKWLSELVWREFYMMIIWHFPQTVTKAFKPPYDQIRWRNDEREFQAWCEGKTGYPLVDAGMRQLNTMGFMHNRVRMVTASFLTKHLLIDWRWGEAYFAGKLLDYELASNIGGWQWAAGSGNDAAPYFRVFNPELQAKRFDPKNEYIYRWAPEYKTGKHVPPIVEHAFARDRVLKEFKRALNE